MVLVGKHFPNAPWKTRPSAKNNNHFWSFFGFGWKLFSNTICIVLVGSCLILMLYPNMEQHQRFWYSCGNFYINILTINIRTTPHVMVAVQLQTLSNKNIAWEGTPTTSHGILWIGFDESKVSPTARKGSDTHFLSSIVWLLVVVNTHCNHPYLHFAFTFINPVSKTLLKQSESLRRQVNMLKNSFQIAGYPAALLIWPTRPMKSISMMIMQESFFAGTFKNYLQQCESRPSQHQWRIPNPTQSVLMNAQDDTMVSRHTAGGKTSELKI